MSAAEPTPVDFDDAFDDWIGGASIAKRSVPIYAKPGLYAEYQQLERDLEIAEAAGKAGGEMAGSGVAAIRERMSDLYDEWMASKSTWVVHALNPDQFEALAHADEGQGLPELVEPKRDPEPVEPAPLPKNRTEQQGKSHTLATNEYRAAKAEWDAGTEAHEKAHEAYLDEINLRGIAASVETITFADGRIKDGITVAQIRVLRERLGQRQTLSLLTAALLANSEEPEIPAPFFEKPSEVDQT